MARLRAHPEDFLVEEGARVRTGRHGRARARESAQGQRQHAVGGARTRALRRLPSRGGRLRRSQGSPRRGHPVAVAAAAARRGRLACRTPGRTTRCSRLHPHTRKLPRGALTGNRFAIRLRPAQLPAAALAALLRPRLQTISRCGVPNYFGPQRFGRAGANLERADEDLRRMRPPERGFILSAARSAMLQRGARGARPRAAGSSSWLGTLPTSTGAAATLPWTPRMRRPARAPHAWKFTPPGRCGAPEHCRAAAQVAQLEASVAARLPQLCAVCVGASMHQERRSLRLAVHDLRLEEEPEAVLLHFRLGRGSFATAVLRELVEPPDDLADL